MIEVRLICQLNDYLNDAQDIPRAFSPALVVRDTAEHYLSWETKYDDGVFIVTITSDLWDSREKELPIEERDDLLFKKYTKRFLKTCLYDYLSEKLSVELPYGSLTGVRPTKLFYELEGQGKDAFGVLKNDFRVIESRASLIRDCVKNQTDCINRDPSAVALFVNIPFCPTRCSYCSFISTEVGRIRKELPRYVEAVRREIDVVNDVVKREGKKVTSIYVGGGTPGSIGAGYLRAILLGLVGYDVEFTVEAGRPDTIDEEMISVLSDCGVTRISINPQTFKQSTLDTIGRKHTLEAFYRAFELARGRFSINMDLICGLPNETVSDFSDSLQKTVSLHPDNITVHSLSLKRGSVMTLEGVEKSYDGTVRRMTDLSIDYLRSAGYSPYYLYRQKNTLDNLENVGYSLPGKQCKYNVDMMEESISVLGVGAGAMTKILEGGKITRISNPKGFREYLDRIEDVIEKKGSIFITR